MQSNYTFNNFQHHQHFTGTLYTKSNTTKQMPVIKYKKRQFLLIEDISQAEIVTYIFTMVLFQATN